MLKKSINIFVAALLLTGIITGCSRKQAQTPQQTDEKAISVSVSKAVRMDIESTVKLNGKVTPNIEVNVIPKVAGKVKKIYIKEGQMVKQGDILFTIEDTDYRLQTEQAAAALNSARVALQKAKGGAVEQQIAQLRSSLALAETNYSDAKNNYQRIKQLFESGGASKQALENAETALKNAQEQYQTAKNNLELTLNKINPENIAAAEAGLKQSQAAYEIAKNQLDNTIVTSPITGIVSSKNIEEGEMAGTAAPVMTVVDLSTVMVEIQVPENTINKIKLGDKVAVKIGSAGIDSIEGTIESISYTADSNTRNYPVKIRISNEKNLLKGGMFAEVLIPVAKADQALAVPLSAVLDEDRQKMIYVAVDGKAQKKEIKTGLADDKFIQVLQGISENEEIIVKGQDFVQDGTKIIIDKE
ncbi:MAG: HlyD family secretion protein [Petroclostridium sp.]|jgi:multidrug efflux pump subunit AcrA (membrane-fusion protein)|nr:HlyD family secretion protein [Petroclostridium sp.]